MDEDLISFKALNWTHRDDNKELKIVISGIAEDGKTITLTVTQCLIHCFFELPVELSKDEAKLFEASISSAYKDYRPLGIKYTKSNRCLYGLKPMNVVMGIFDSVQKMRYVAKTIASRRFYVPSLGWIEGIKVHEQTIDPVLRFASYKKLNLAGFVLFSGTEVEDKQYKTDLEYTASFEDVKEGISEAELSPKVLCFDIECTCSNIDSRIPDPSDPLNEVFMIAVTTQKRIIRSGFEDILEIHKYLLTIGETEEIPEITSLFCEDEKDLILSFGRLVEGEDPDVLTGYNILKFDWLYLFERAKINGVGDEFLKFLNRERDKPAPIVERIWDSSAYGIQKFVYPDDMRLQIDVFTDVSKNYRLSKNSLDYAAEFFLGKHKDDLTPKQLFYGYGVATRIRKAGENIGKKDDFFGKINPKFISFYERFEGSDEEKKKIGREILTLIGKYCLIDVELTLELYEKLNIWKNTEAMSGVSKIPISWINVRGQQIRIFGLILRICEERKLIIPTMEKKESGEKYSGAFVVRAIPGKYDLVSTLDFESLYPSIMQAYNICFSTLVTSASVPDSDCFHIEWEEHKNCEHDQTRDVNSFKSIICGRPMKYRFLKPRLVDGKVEGEGVIPFMLRELLTSRKKVKKEMEMKQQFLYMHQGKLTEEEIDALKDRGLKVIGKGELAKDEEFRLKTQIVELNSRQSSIKVCCNSCYGSLGTETGYLPFMIGAMCITAKGREFINSSIEFIHSKYPELKVIYGDSVTGDTPILCKKGDKIFYQSIDSVGDSWMSDLEKEIFIPEDLEVWSDVGFTKIRKVIRHKTSKKIFRILSHTGIVDCTEDHSLLLSDGKEVKPIDVAVGTELMIAKLPKISEFSLSFKEEFHFELKDKIKSANFFLFLSNVGYSVTLDIEDNTIKFSISRDKSENSGSVKKIIDLGTTSDFVYDLETENHHFSAGIGQLVVHNTDSTFVKFPPLEDEKNLKDYFLFSERISKEISHFLRCKTVGIDPEFVFSSGETISSKTVEEFLDPDEKQVLWAYKTRPINLTFEKFFSTLLLLTKKRYAGLIENAEGKQIGHLERGIILSRRDNCLFVRKVYKGVIDRVFAGKSRIELEDFILEEIQHLYRRGVTESELLISAGIKNPFDYVEKKKAGMPFDPFNNPYIDAEKKPIVDEHGCAVNITDIKDPRLRWRSLKQAKICERVIKRGEVPPTNVRIEIVFLRGGDKASDKAEEYTYFKENRILLAGIDREFYISNYLANPINAVIDVVFGRKTVEYEPILEVWNRERPKETPRIAIKRGKEKGKFDSLASSVNSKTIMKRLYKQHGLRFPAERRGTKTIDLFKTVAEAREGWRDVMFSVFESFSLRGMIEEWIFVEDYLKLKKLKIFRVWPVKE